MKSDLIKNGEEPYYDERSAGGIVYRINEGKVLWLVIKTVGSNVSNKIAEVVYKFPKGHLQGKEFLKQAALREVEEEGGIKAEIVSKIGSNDYIIWDKIKKKEIIKKVTFFLMKYVDESRLKHFDMEVVLAKEWLPFEEAGKKLAYKSERVLLKKAKIRLERLI